MTVKAYDHFSEWPKDEWPWKNFSPWEMASKREGAIKLDTDAMHKLQKLRLRLQKPLLITSAYRSPAHNRAVGGAKNSYHMQGVAFDVRMENHDPHHFRKIAQDVGFTGFGYYIKNGFMHIDTGPAREWGKMWPRNDVGVPTEPPRVPERLREDKQAGAALGAAGSSAVGMALEAAPAAQGLLGNLAPTAQIIAIVAAVGFISFLLWKRIKG